MLAWMATLVFLVAAGIAIGAVLLQRTHPACMKPDPKWANRMTRREGHED